VVDLISDSKSLTACTNIAALIGNQTPTFVNYETNGIYQGFAYNFVPAGYSADTWFSIDFADMQVMTGPDEVPISEDKTDLNANSLRNSGNIHVRILVWGGSYNFESMHLESAV